jgi:adenylate cyclase
MAIEIERKFLVIDDGWRSAACSCQCYRQGYLAHSSRGAVRVRLAGDVAYITVKGNRIGISRPEFEYPIPVDDAEAMLQALCKKPLLEKTRHRVPHEGLIWEVDVYCGAADGLVVAEVELQRADQPVILPAWVGWEVTQDAFYSNAAIAARIRKIGKAASAPLRDQRGPIAI